METKVIESYLNFGTGDGKFAWKHNLIEIDGGELQWVKEKVELEIETEEAA